MLFCFFGFSLGPDKVNLSELLVDYFPFALDCVNFILDFNHQSSEKLVLVSNTLNKLVIPVHAYFHFPLNVIRFRPEWFGLNGRRCRSIHFLLTFDLGNLNNLAMFFRSSKWCRRRRIRRNITIILFTRCWISSLFSYHGRWWFLLTALFLLRRWRYNWIAFFRSRTHSLQCHFPPLRSFVFPTACAPLWWRSASRCPFLTAVGATADAWRSRTYCSSTLTCDSRKYWWHHCRPNFLGEDHGNSFD